MGPPRKSREFDSGSIVSPTRFRDLRDAETAVGETNGEIEDLRRALDNQRESHEGLKKQFTEDQRERQKLDRELYERIGALNAKVTIMLYVMSGTLLAVAGGVVTLVLRR